MKFEWDEHKNKANISKHSIDFNDVPDMFKHPMLTLLDARDYAEDRYLSMGMLLSLVGVVIHTEREEDIIRIISARKATKREVKEYAAYIKNQS